MSTISPSTKLSGAIRRCCRVCGHDLFPQVLLRYAGMPKAAQYLPEEKDLPLDCGVDLEVRQCAGCGLVQLSNEPVPYFKEVIRAAGFSEEMKAFRREQLKRFVQEQGLRGKKVLEVGCGRGEYLSLVSELEVRATGLEFSEDSVASAKRQGMDVLQGFLSDGEVLPQAPYDAFLIFSFLEHLPNPNGSLRGIHANLSEGAVGLVEVPNFDMILERDMFSEFIGDHLFYFTRDSLTATLSRNGFVLLRCDEVWHGYILSALVQKRRSMDLSRFEDRQVRLQSEIDGFIGRFKPRQVAAWGAGHQALAILALANLGGKLRYVVDSATFKQGRFTPATHIPIVSPDALESDPVEAIIVMAASYSDEVVETLRERYPGRFHISVLRDWGLETVGS